MFLLDYTLLDVISGPMDPLLYNGIDSSRRSRRTGKGQKNRGVLKNREGDDLYTGGWPTSMALFLPFTCGAVFVASPARHGGRRQSRFSQLETAPPAMLQGHNYTVHSVSLRGYPRGKKSLQVIRVFFTDAAPSLSDVIMHRWGKPREKQTSSRPILCLVFADGHVSPILRQKKNPKKTARGEGKYGKRTRGSYFVDIRKEAKPRPRSQSRARASLIAGRAGVKRTGDRAYSLG